DDQGRIVLIDELMVDGGVSLTTPTVLYRFHLGNHLGSALLESDYSGNMISFEEYYPFGSSSYRSGRNSAETSLKRYRYVGKERDDETGLYYYGARYYAAWLARFVSVDPLKDDYPQLTPYQYASNDPVGDVDIDGLEGTKTKSPPMVKSDATNIDPLRDKRLSLQLSQKQRQEKQQRLKQLLSGEGLDPRNDPNATFLSPASNKSEAQRQKELRQFEFKENIQRLKEGQLATQGEFAFRMSEDPMIKGVASGLIVGVVAESVAGSQAARTLLPKVKPFAERFLVDAATQSLAKAIDRFQETGKVEFRAGDIDLANAFFKGALGKLSKDNPALVLVEEGLKTLVDLDTDDGLVIKDLIDDQNKILAEFGLRIAFKFIPGGSGKDDLGNTVKNPTKEFVIEVFKKQGRNEAKEILLRDQGTKHSQ
ncbi:RHS repeat domain-containing protein, partial [Fulvivirga sp. M361]|uniref:RHS repeat domain-containing protein n=1 Tax=Fulvivirga sp. M361 TaxID=2594266 RepID=UPI001C86EB29